MNIAGYPKRILFTLPAADVVGSTAVYLAVQPPIGAAFDVVAVLDSTASGINSYHADLTAAQTLAGGAGLWRVMPKITGADSAIFPKSDNAAVLDFEVQWDTAFKASLLLSPSALREHVSTSLLDPALARIIAGEEEEIVSRYGAHASQVDAFDDDAPGPLLFPSRPVLSITSIAETVLSRWDFTGEVGGTPVTLAATDYELVPGGRQIRRLASGTHPRSDWGHRVTLTYVPVSEVSKRILALVDLCKLQLAFNGLDSESVGGGEYKMTMGDFNARREAILSGLGSAQRGFA